MSSSGNMVRIGFVGCGEQGLRCLLPALSRLNVAKICAVADTDRANADRGAASYSAIPFSSCADLLASCSVDALIAACPPSGHEEVAKLAIEHRLPFFVEKPPARTTRTLLELSDGASQADVVNRVGMSFRYSDSVRQFLDVLNSREYGNPIGFEAFYYAGWPVQLRWDLPTVVDSFCKTHLVHMIDIMTLCVPEVKFLSGVLNQNNDGRFFCSAHFEGENSVPFSLSFSNSGPRLSFGVRCLTDQSMTIELDGFRSVVTSTIGNKRHSLRWEASSRGSTLEGYETELLDFLALVNSLEREVYIPTLGELCQSYRMMDELEGLKPCRSSTT